MRNFKRQNNRKPIDTFVVANDSRFEPIDKSPKILSNIKKVTGLAFKAYKQRPDLFPEPEPNSFYDANKEVTMKNTKTGTLPW